MTIVGNDGCKVYERNCLSVHLLICVYKCICMYVRLLFCVYEHICLSVRLLVCVSKHPYINCPKHNTKLASSLEVRQEMVWTFQSNNSFLEDRNYSLVLSGILWCRKWVHLSPASLVKPKVIRFGFCWHGSISFPRHTHTARMNNELWIFDLHSFLCFFLMSIHIRDLFFSIIKNVVSFPQINLK